MDVAVLMFTTLSKMSVHAVPLRKILIEYIGKYTIGNDNTYQHFLQIVYMTASSPTTINTAVIVMFRKTICFFVRQMFLPNLVVKLAAKM